jgi:hypothetical protein
LLALEGEGRAEDPSRRMRASEQGPPGFIVSLIRSDRTLRSTTSTLRPGQGVSDATSSLLTAVLWRDKPVRVEMGAEWDNTKGVRLGPGKRAATSERGGGAGRGKSELDFEVRSI